ncbi:hypothetical protein ABPG75_011981 [Micractinium tetrahymenae]
MADQAAAHEPEVHQPPGLGRRDTHVVTLAFVPMLALTALGGCSSEATFWTGCGVLTAAAMACTELLRCAAGKLALRALAGSLMLVCLVVGIYVWRCTALCAALAGIPLALAGGACILISSRPRAAVLLARAALLSSVCYCVAAVVFCKACKGAPGRLLAATLLGALAGAATDSQTFGAVAAVLLPEEILEVVHAEGLLSESLVPEDWDGVNYARLGLAALVALVVFLHRQVPLELCRPGR